MYFKVVRNFAKMFKDYKPEISDLRRVNKRLKLCETVADR